MEGYKFREKRESIEKMFEEVNSLIEGKSIELASRRLKTSRKLLNDLSAKDLSEIQQRSAFNLKVKGNNFAVIINKVIEKDEKKSSKNH